MSAGNTVMLVVPTFCLLTFAQAQPPHQGQAAATVSSQQPVF
jgi:hypothetical protein